MFTPGQPDDPHQPRPSIVISENVRNRLRDDLIVVPLFSSGRLGPTRVAISQRGSGLRRDSVAFCEEITTIDRDFLHRGPVGKLSDTQMESIVWAVRRAVGDVIPER